jgi:hypothetical protein
VNSSAIIRVIILVVACFLAVYMGSLLATSKGEALLWVALTALIVMCCWLGRDIWLLIPLTANVTLMFPWLPGGFPPSKLSIFLVFGWSLMLIAMRRLPLSFRFTHIEAAAVLLLSTILQAYVRNPVGLRVFGTDSVGAKPYMLIIISTIGFVVLASLRVSPDRIRKAMWVTLGGSLASTAINTLAYFSSAVAAITGPTLGAFGKGDFLKQGRADLEVVDPTRATRVGFAIEVSNLLSRWITSKRNPLRCLMNPFWGGILIVAVAAAALSGYRNALVATGLTLVCGAYYWGRFVSVVIAGFLGLIAYLLLVMVNPVVPLPPNIQRTMTILPGPWEDQYKEDAKASTKWRTDMWKLALTTDRYIQNKFLGDGLGMTQQEYRFVASLADFKAISDEMTQERAMATQAYHSGPVQTIRVTGYVGLIVLLYAMILVAVRAHRLIMRCKGTEWFGVVLFLTMHMVWHPFFFTFVFGAYGDDVPALLMNMGMLRLIEKNLPLQSVAPVVAPAALPASPRRGRAQARIA